MAIKLIKACKELNIGMSTAVEFSKKQGREIATDPNTRIDDDLYLLLAKEFNKDMALKMEAERMAQERQEREIPKELKIDEPKAPVESVQVEQPKIKVVGSIDLDADKKAKEEAARKAKEEKAREEAERAAAQKAEEERKAAEERRAREEAERAAAIAAEKKAAHEAAERARKEAERMAAAAASTAAPAPAPEPVKTPMEKKLQDKASAGLKVVGKIDLSSLNQATHPGKKSKEEKKKEREAREQQRRNQRADNHANENAQAAAGSAAGDGEKRKRERIRHDKVDINDARNQKGGKPSKNNKKNNIRVEVDDEEVQRQIKETLNRLQGQKGKTATSKHKRERRELEREKMAEARAEEQAQSKVLKLTEFVTANDLATMMNVPVTKVIGTCMLMGVMVSINQRLDAETINLVAEEFGYTTEYVSAHVTEEINADEEINEEDMEERCPIVTVMGHVDHGKTSLLDHIRNTNVIAGEAGGITQHIGAYNVKLKNGRHITFLDTPGHEAFTAMRARGAKVTDIAIIIVAADDAVMPQTIEAINHAQAAGVPMIFAINKCDKPGANPDKIKEQLSNMNILIEEWGGKYQSQDISAKKGDGVFELLEKVLLEADMLELKANPKRRAKGSIIESSLDKGRGYVATVLVSDGTLHMGDIVLAGTYHGKIKAMFNERGQKIKEALPGEPCMLLGLNGAPQAGDEFNVLPTEQEAREIANKREQLQREQSLRTKKHIGLDEIGRRLAIGDFKEINLIVKGDVDGSVEALSDSLIKLSTENIQVNVIHGAVGAISDSDVLLAAASNAIIVGFNVRPTATARKMAESEEVDIRIYSIIYDAIEELKAAMSGMLSPDIKEEVTATLEILQTFHISKVGTIAGCIVREGKAKRANKCRVIRDGIVIHTGELSSLKHGKDDIKEIGVNQECGLSIKAFNDIVEGDMIETFEQVEVAKSL
ncbi:MAG: translation initiation factor IF-2 [Paludibacteraceae bacterium]|nr:translation initiation factor IF-2 [Paludibacteraceae bacterium]